MKLAGFRLTIPALLLAGLALGFLVLLYQSGLIAVWLESDEYSHGLMLLLVLGYVVYRRAGELALPEPRYAWPALGVALLALALALVGAAAGIQRPQMYSVWLFGVAVCLATGGPALLLRMFPLLLIAFMVIPLPGVLELLLTARLQLISSQLGVWLIRLFGGVVYLEGNIIDMGEVKLLVAEACAGLRYLYPLLGLSALGGYLLRASAWRRWALFLSAIPITIFMNSFRIAVTGLLAEKWGLEPSEGFLHFFEGWVVFVAAMLVLLLVAWLLVRSGSGTRRLADAFALEGAGAPAPAAASGEQRSHRPLGAVAVVLLTAAVLTPLLAIRSDQVPERQPLTSFPLTIDKWASREYRLPPLVEEVAGASDYFYGDFRSDSGVVNLYVSYYETQRQGRIPHSPAVCIPGDGWRIVSASPVSIDGHQEFEVNRLVMEKGSRTVLAYYWLKQGARMYREELLARLDLIRLSALERRTDGALIRLVAELGPTEGVADVDARLVGFARSLTPILPAYVPD